MLILTRKPGESIRVGDDITLRFIGLHSRTQARLAIHAPRHVEIDREEIRRRKLAERGQGA